MKQLIKSVYGLVPFKKELFSVLKVFYKLPPEIYRHLHFRSKIHVPVSGTRGFDIQHYGFEIENSLFWSGLEKGDWEAASLNAWLKLSKVSNGIFDVGANTGVYALLSACVNSKADIHAFEPVARVYDKLIKNIKLNDYKIAGNEVALSNKTGTGVIYDQDSEHTYSVTVGENRVSGGIPTKETVIQLITLDDYVAKNNIEALELIKIDVEGHELEVLQGALKSLTKFRPAMFVEILDSQSGVAITGLLKGLGYMILHIKEDQNKLIEVDTPFPDGLSYNFIFCKPEIASYLTQQS